MSINLLFFLSLAWLAAMEHELALLQASAPGVKATAGLGTLALSDGVWADPQRRLSVQ